jgi:hypothetical protein
MKKPTTSLTRPPSLIDQPGTTRAPMPPPRRTNSQQRWVSLRIEIHSFCVGIFSSKESPTAKKKHFVSFS